MIQYEGELENALANGNAVVVRREDLVDLLKHWEGMLEIKKDFSDTGAYRWAEDLRDRVKEALTEF